MQTNQLLYLSRADVVAAGPSMAEIIDVLEITFRAKGEGRAEMPPKPGIHPGGTDNFIHAMPAYIPDIPSAGIKWVSGFPENYKKGLPYINGLLILNDVDTGLPLSVMDCVWITAMRTGAATALSARYLARPDSEVVGILGCGVQGRSNVEALKVLFPLKKVYAYDINQDAARQYAQEVSERFALEVVTVSEPRQAVSGCDIVVTAGPILKIPHATIKSGWLDEGAFASLVDFDSYWHGDALQESSKFCTDDTAQLRQYQQAGYFQNIPEIHADLGELVAGKRPGRQTREERTMTANLGLALEDMAVAQLIYKRALEQNIGTWLPL
ncbi:MAG: ornithine cyclodeaminase family protein [Deltaproteobacteria bacterium]|nr:ornithine cyclodeaminase family protein [Deltaproteobacteria bacterium]MBW2069870.1 ornithine cyclodeaminase family protein [Deltaproteobacteria bacterium]